MTMTGKDDIMMKVTYTTGFSSGPPTRPDPTPLRPTRVLNSFLNGAPSAAGNLNTSKYHRRKGGARFVRGLPLHSARPSPPLPSPPLHSPPLAFPRPPMPWALEGRRGRGRWGRVAVTRLLRKRKRGWYRCSYGIAL